MFLTAAGRDVHAGEDEIPMEDEFERAAAARKGSPFLNSAQAAHYLGLSERTLEDMREKGEGPPCRKHGRRNVRYHIADIEAWSDARKLKNASEMSLIRHSNNDTSRS
ncbi:MAG TPA: helix-turn-helix domain-containing protein [Rhizomicrobium sp.]